MGIGGAGSRRAKTIAGLGVLFVIPLALLLTPSCGGGSTTGSNSSSVTPKNTYTFTLTGADENGAAPGNSTTSPATVSLTVD